MQDWYSVSGNKIEEIGGETILQYHYRYNLPAALRELYPEHKWVNWSFSRLPKGFWDDLLVQKSYLEWLLTEVFRTTSEDLEAFYGLTQETLQTQHGSYLLSIYGDIHSMLKTIYPDHEWDRWRFNAQALWDVDAVKDNISQLEAFVKHLAFRLSVPENELESWYRISHLQMNAVGMLSTVRRIGGLPTLLQKVFPDHQWDPSKFIQAHKRSQQLLLKKVLQEIFPGSEIEEGYKIAMAKSAKIVGDIPEIDLYLPAFKIGFEYQGEQHFRDVRKVSQTDSGLAADSTKHALCFREGISLFDVPYWWDGSKTTLHNSIHSRRPDVLQHSIGDGEMIPESAPGDAGVSKQAKRGRKPRQKQLKSP
jgi:hypothetical protein